MGLRTDILRIVSYQSNPLFLKNPTAEQLKIGARITFLTEKGAKEVLLEEFEVMTDHEYRRFKGKYFERGMRMGTFSAAYNPDKGIGTLRINYF